MKKTVMIGLIWAAFSAARAETLAAWDFWGLSTTPAPGAQTAAVYAVSQAPVLSRVTLGNIGATNNFVANSFSINSTLATAVSDGKYFAFSLTHTNSLTVTNIALRIARAIAQAPTGFTLRVSSDPGFSTYTDTNFTTVSTSGIYNRSAALNVSGSAVYCRLYGYGNSVDTSARTAGFGGGSQYAAGGSNAGLNGTLYDLLVEGTVQSTPPAVRGTIFIVE